jgi:hypothetical protein
MLECLLASFSELISACFFFLNECLLGVLFNECLLGFFSMHLHQQKKTMKKGKKKKKLLYLKDRLQQTAPRPKAKNFD